jgi:hypothetical protein
MVNKKGGGMRVNMHKILDDCIERGLAVGFARAHKHTDNPTTENLLEAQQQAIVNELDVYFIFDENEV